MKLRSITLRDPWDRRLLWIESILLVCTLAMDWQSKQGYIQAEFRMTVTSQAPPRRSCSAPRCGSLTSWLWLLVGNDRWSSPLLLPPDPLNTTLLGPADWTEGHTGRHGWKSRAGHRLDWEEQNGGHWQVLTQAGVLFVYLSQWIQDVSEVRTGREGKGWRFSRKPCCPLCWSFDTFRQPIWGKQCQFTPSANTNKYTKKTNPHICSFIYCCFNT